MFTERVIPMSEDALLELRDTGIISLATGRQARRALVGEVFALLEKLHDNAQSIRHWSRAAGEQSQQIIEQFIGRLDKELTVAFADYLTVAFPDGVKGEIK